MAESIFNPGQRVKDYLIEKQIGKGGMAELFLARDLGLRKRVVIKALIPLFNKKEDFKEQFLREARIQANLDNPHIVQIFRIFNYRYNLCLVMQHVAGTDLAKVIKKAKSIRGKRREKGALSTERAVHIFLQILEGIGCAHRFRIIHGDIKPPNILFDKQGRVKVSDFGLSFLLPYGKREKGEISLGGTPSYMSPEQILDKGADVRSDIYSLGVTFFHMLTGDLPSGDKKKLMELLEFHLEGSLDRPKRILDQFEGIHPRIKEAILKALENDPDNRHQSCLEFSLAIRVDAPYEMYSELLRLSFLTKRYTSLAERAYLDKIAERKGLGPGEAKRLEINIRKEMRLPPLDFTKEYKKALEDLLKKRRESEDIDTDKLYRVYVRQDRLSKTHARLIREKMEVKKQNG